MGKITCVVSGGQTGTDQGALAAARELGIKTDGYAAANYETDVGPNPALLRDIYGLRECDGGYVVRDRANVDLLHEHDILVGFRLSARNTGVGTDMLMNYFTTGRYEMFERALTPSQSVILGSGRAFVVWDLSEDNLDKLAKWLRGEIQAAVCSEARLLVRGPSESTRPGFGDLVRRLLLQALA